MVSILEADKPKPPPARVLLCLAPPDLSSRRPDQTWKCYLCGRKDLLKLMVDTGLGVYSV